MAPANLNISSDNQQMFRMFADPLSRLTDETPYRTIHKPNRTCSKMMDTKQTSKDSYVSFSSMNVQPLPRRAKMKRLAFKVKVYEGRQDEFKRLYQDLAPELVNSIEEYGIKKLAVYLDENTSEVTCTLFYPEQIELQRFLSEEPILLWRLIANTLMDTDEKGLPIIVFLTELYYHDPVENY